MNNTFNHKFSDDLTATVRHWIHPGGSEGRIVATSAKVHPSVVIKKVWSFFLMQSSHTRPAPFAISGAVSTANGYPTRGYGSSNLNASNYALMFASIQLKMIPSWRSRDVAAMENHRA